MTNRSNPKSSSVRMVSSSRMPPPNSQGTPEAFTTAGSNMGEALLPRSIRRWRANSGKSLEKNGSVSSARARSIRPCTISTAASGLGMPPSRAPFRLTAATGLADKAARAGTIRPGSATGCRASKWTGLPAISKRGSRLPSRGGSSGPWRVGQSRGRGERPGRGHAQWAAVRIVGG